MFALVAVESGPIGFDLARWTVVMIGVIVALAVPWPGVPNPWAFSGYSAIRWLLAILTVIMLFMMWVR